MRLRIGSGQGGGRMLKNSRLLGICLWLFSFQVIAFTKGGLLAQHPWLDVGTALGMFTVAAFLLGLSLPAAWDLGFGCVMVIIAASTAVLTARFCQQMPYQWYDLMIVMAAPQVFFMAIGFWMGNRRQPADLQVKC
ncbi:MAG: hypothetical protein NTZ49_03815 [Candidatus Parcubacteria bacterium]|nr:hypothetical protein [Candidatus Parcubacteria bacterium]